MPEWLPSLKLKKGEDRRLRGGHLWVFSNEVDNTETPLKAFEPGQPALLRDHADRPIGTVYVNPHSLICARLVSRDPNRTLDTALLTERLGQALALRVRLFPEPCYRLVHGDGDGLSGLIIDRYGDSCVVQANTAGMERALSHVITALRATVAPRHILLRGDSPMRELEGLDRYQRWVDEPGPEVLELRENGARFRVASQDAQKTGWYYDHRASRARLQPYVRGKRVLDVFSYVGAWGVQSLVSGADNVTCVDSSSAALDRAAENAALNHVPDRLATVEGDAFTVLQALREERRRYDVVIVDPPAFVKRKKDLKKGLAGYRRLNQLAMQVLEKNGILITASCSSHVTADALLQEALSAARHLDRGLQVIEAGQQAPDHPVHPAIPETRYLKTWFCRVLPASEMP
ncbi:MAG: class I SAM-dependent rRNA methyltransferase [Ectothiorhodospiraceae bacterium]|nr:class I SAM-dependent rRNA methyltransferase [Ectothiorhodospiraceae bacterium]